MRKVFAIDLGTTNSYIAYDGKIIGDVVKSVVDLTKKKTAEVTDTKAIRSFKVDISEGDEGLPSVIASSIVLKKLISQVPEPVEDVVISVPAFFTENQRSATKKAAELAGLNVRALINEPTAAALMYSDKAKKLTVVYDLGGGTFDVSVIDSRTSMYDILATDGIILGGDDLDLALMRVIIKRAGVRLHRLTPELRRKLQIFAERAKLLLQQNPTSPCKLDLSEFGEVVLKPEVVIHPDEYDAVVKKTFDRTIEELFKVINEAIFEDEEYDIILVGGSTRCPFLQKWIREVTGKEVIQAESFNPDLIVAQGASLYAKLIEEGIADMKVSDVTTALSIGLNDGTVKVIIPKNSKVPAKEEFIFTNPEETKTLQIEVYQGDSILAENNTLLGTLEYHYDRVMEKDESTITIGAEVDRNGLIKFYAQELLGKKEAIVLNRGNTK